MIRLKDNGPSFFIVGAPKCGTTSVARYLEAHPDVYMVTSEPHFFGRDIRFNRELLSEDVYIKLFENAKGAARVGEVSTWYLFSKYAAQEIADYRPDAKIIIQIRNPVDMLYSLHSHLYYKTRREDIKDFAKALDAEKDRIFGRRIPRRARFVEHLFYSQVAKYTSQIIRYVNTFGSDNIHIVVFDDLSEDPESVYRALLSFLNLDYTANAKLLVHNASVARKSFLLHEITYSPLIASAGRRLLPANLVKRLRKLRRRVASMNLKPFHRPPLQEHVRQRLKDEFRAEVEALSDLVGRNLTHWVQ